MFSKSIAVLEAGASHAAFGRFQFGRGRRLRLVEYAAAPFALAPDRDRDWPARVGEAMQVLPSRVRWRGPVAVILPAHLLLAKFLKIPRVKAAHRARIIEFEARQHIPYAWGDVVWGNAVVGEMADGSDVLLCAAKLNAVEPLCAAAAAAGFAPQRVLPCSLGTVAAAGLLAGAVEPGTMLVKVGARSTTLVLAVKTGSHLRSFALGGNLVTTEIARRQQTDFATAETMKLSGEQRGAIDLAAAVLATQLGQEIIRSVLHFRSRSAEASATRILLTGGGARLPALPSLLSERLNLPAGILDLSDAVVAGSECAVAESGLGLTAMLGAAALLLSGEARQMDLLPPTLAERVTRRRRRLWLAAAAAISVASLAPPVVHFRAAAAISRRQCAAIEHELEGLRPRDNRNRANLLKLEEVTRQIAVLQDWRGRRVAWLMLLADLQQRLGEVGDVWLDRLQLMPASKPGGGGKNPSLAPRLFVSGRMLDKANPLAKVSDATYARVKDLLARIARSPLIASAESEAFDNSQPGVLRFSFALSPAASHPL